MTRAGYLVLIAGVLAACGGADARIAELEERLQAAESVLGETEESAHDDSMSVDPAGGGAETKDANEGDPPFTPDREAEQVREAQVAVDAQRFGLAIRLADQESNFSYPTIYGPGEIIGHGDLGQAGFRLGSWCGGLPSMSAMARYLGADLLFSKYLGRGLEHYTYVFKSANHARAYEQLLGLLEACPEPWFGVAKEVDAVPGDCRSGELCIDAMNVKAGSEWTVEHSVTSAVEPAQGDFSAVTYVLLTSDFRMGSPDWEVIGRADRFITTREGNVVMTLHAYGWCCQNSFGGDTWKAKTTLPLPDLSSNTDLATVHHLRVLDVLRRLGEESPDSVSAERLVTNAIFCDTFDDLAGSGSLYELGADERKNLGRALSEGPTDGEVAALARGLYLASHESEFLKGNVRQMAQLGVALCDL